MSSGAIRAPHRSSLEVQANSLQRGTARAPMTDVARQRRCSIPFGHRFIHRAPACARSIRRSRAEV